jgi:putative transposase
LSKPAQCAARRLFKSRFASVAMDDVHLIAAVCYVSLNPARARLVGHAVDWEWSSVWAHLAGADDRLVTVRPVLDRVACFADLLLEDRDEAFTSARRR